VPVAIECRGARFDEGFRADIIAENKVIIELKSGETMSNARRKQVLTYLKLGGRGKRRKIGRKCPRPLWTDSGQAAAKRCSRNCGAGGFAMPRAGPSRGFRERAPVPSVLWGLSGPSLTGQRPPREWDR